MPCLGRIPFLRDYCYSNETMGEAVSMPCLGRIPFLPLAYKGGKEVMMQMCQCPVSGESHFYFKGLDTDEFRESVSMPCLGRIPFLHIASEGHEGSV